MAIRKLVLVTSALHRITDEEGEVIMRKKTAQQLEKAKRVLAGLQQLIDDDVEGIESPEFDDLVEAVDEMIQSLKADDDAEYDEIMNMASHYGEMVDPFIRVLELEVGRCTVMTHPLLL